MSCLFTPPDIQAALYELCWQVVQGNLKLDFVISVLGDMMVKVLLVLGLKQYISTLCYVLVFLLTFLFLSGTPR